MKLIGSHIVLLLIVIAFSCKTNQISESKKYVKKPNILILHVDDLGYHDLSINGSKIYQTPNIDKLASESIVFDNAYANYPRCVPSRFAMMTARYPVQNGDVPDDGFEIEKFDNNKNYIKAIKNEGYQTAFFGKWHLGSKQSVKDFGFDYVFAAGHAGSPISYFYPFNVKKRKGESKKNPIPDIDEVGKPGDYLTYLMTDKLIDYIKNRDTHKPFLIEFAFYAVHQPLEAKKEDIQRNRKEINSFDFGDQPEYINEGTGRTKMRQDNPVYAGMVENLDENISKILQTLKDIGLENNTIIVFSSDHGGLSNDGTKKRHLATSNYPLRAGKGHLYEGGIKIPLFIKWNDKFKQRKEKKSLVMLMDIFPTLYDIVSGKKLISDGKSFLPVIYNKENWQDRIVFWHSSKARPVNTGDSKSSAIRDGDYKLIDFYNKKQIELYNLASDPYEKVNLAKKEPNTTKLLLYKLNKWKKEKGINND